MAPKKSHHIEFGERSVKRNGTRTTRSPRRTRKAGPPKGPAAPTERPRPSAPAPLLVGEPLGPPTAAEIAELCEGLLAGTAHRRSPAGDEEPRQAGTNEQVLRVLGGVEVHLRVDRFAAALGIA